MAANHVPRKPIAERFWKFVLKPDTEDGCWTWVGGTTTAGYGIIGAGGRNGASLLAHRVSWEIHNGPITDGLFVCHHCDNPSCIRPSHLFLGTQKDNLQDASRKGHMHNWQVLHPEFIRRGELHWSRFHPERIARGEGMTTAKLTETDVREIRELYATGKYYQRQLANMFGVTQSNIWCVVSRQTWKHVQ